MNLNYTIIGSSLTLLLLLQVIGANAQQHISLADESRFIAANGQSLALKLDPHVRRGKLSNGLTYYIRQNKTKAGEADFLLVNKVGSVNEQEHERGLAHFVEHMAFNGTKHFEKNSLIDYLQKQGVRFGADLNAYTGFDETVYLFPLPTQNQEVVVQGLQILRDWAGDVSFDPVEIDQERGVILEEKRATNDVNRRKLGKILPITTNNSRYASRMPIGTEEVLKGFKRKDIVNFYETWYRPDRQAIIVVGDIDVEKIEQIIKTKFSDLKVKTNNPTPAIDAIKLGSSMQYLLVTDPEITELNFQLTIKNLGQIRNDVPAYRYALMETLLSSMFRNRFMDLSRKNDAPYKAVMVGYGEAIGGLKNTTMSVQPKDGRLEDAIVEGYLELLRVKQFGFTAAEFQQAQKQLYSYYEKQLAEKNKVSSNKYTEKYKTEFLKGTTAMDILDEQQLGLQLLKDIRLEDVNAALQIWLKEEDRDLLFFAPENLKSKIPDQKMVLSWLAKAEKQSIKPYVPVPVLTQFMDASRLKPGHIVENNTNSKQGTTLLKLSNGVKVILKPTDFKDDEILISAVSPGGTSLVSDADFRNAVQTASIHSMSGVGNIPPSALVKMLLTKKLRVGPYIGDYDEGIQATSGRADLENALQLTHLYFTQPRLDDESYQKVVEAMRTSIENRYKMANNVMSDSLSIWLTNNHLRRRPMTAKDVDQLDKSKMSR